jgi:hypothetical protein
MKRVSSPRALLSLAATALTLLGPAAAFAATFSEEGATVLGGANLSGRSVSLADIDNDGDLDAFFQGSTSADRQMFRNNIIGTGSFTFTNVTSTMIPSGLSASWSAGWGDYNGDGRVDVFVGQTNNSGNFGDVLRNNGTSFSNETDSTGLNDPGFEIYLQGAGQSFTKVGAQVGIQVAPGTKAYGTAIGDTDGDGDLDLYVSTCTGTGSGTIRNGFFQNMLVETGELFFEDVADSNGTQIMYNTYGSEFLDLDDDGDLDLYVTGADGNNSKILRNNGNNTFTDIDTITNKPLLNSNGTDLNGSKAVDYDNDGDLDLYFHDNTSPTGVNQKLYRNDGNWTFADVTVTAGLSTAAGGMVVGAGGYDSAWGDLDRDGDQDLVHPNNQTYNSVIPTPERIYINDASTNGNHWLYVELAGPTENTTGLGATLFATVNEGTPEEVTRRREANTNIGTFNQSDLPVHFGLGAATLIDELLIQWPDGTKQSLYDVAVDQYLTVEYLPGDYSGNGIVDAADYAVWRDWLGTTYKQSDYDVWKANFGNSLSGSGGLDMVVPEPASLSLVLLTGWMAAIARRRTPRLENFAPTAHAPVAR